MKYRVKAGQQHGVNGQYGPGDVVELTVDEYLGFEDKLEPISPLPDPEPPADEVEQEEYPAPIWRALEADHRLEEPGDLVFLSDDELLEIKGVGEKALAEIREYFPYSG